MLLALLIASTLQGEGPEPRDDPSATANAAAVLPQVFSAIVMQLRIVLLMVLLRRVVLSRRTSLQSTVCHRRVNN